MQFRTRKPGRQRGSMIAELAVACLLFIPISILGSSMLICEMATSLNDRACRDAARVAAEAPDFATALKRAQAAIASHASCGPVYGPVRLDTSKFIFEDYYGNPPPNELPYVSVTTIMPCITPAPIKIFGVQIGMAQSVNFTRTYRFPIVKLKLYIPD